MGKISNFFHKILENKNFFWPLTVLTFIFTRIAVWLYPFDSDHWIFYYVGRKFAEGGTMYVSAFDHKPPLIFAFNGVMHILFGGDLVLHRIFLTALAILEIFLFFKLLKIVVPKLNLKNPLFAQRAGLILYIFYRNLSQIASSGNNTENIGVLFFIGMMILYFKYLEKKRLSLLFFAGVCLSFLFFLKGNFLLLGIPIGLLLLLDDLKDLKKFLLSALVYGLPLVIHSAFWLLYFDSKNALSDFLLGSFLFSAKYSKVAWGGNLSNNPNLTLSVIIFILPFLAFLALFIYQNKISQNRIRLFLALYLLVSIIITLGVGPAYPYYFLIVLPILILLIVSTVEEGLKQEELIKVPLFLLLFIGMIGSFAISSKQIYNFFTGPAEAEFTEYKAVAKYIENNSEPDDKVFNYDYGATFYRLAARDSGTRFISASIPLLDEREHFGFGFDDIFIKEMTANKTKFVVINKNPNNIYYQNKKLIDFFNKNYKEDEVFEHFKVLRIK